MNISLHQLNFVIGDLKGNLQKIQDSILSTSSDLCVFSELSLTGYPPKDLLSSPEFIVSVEQAISVCVEWSKAIPNGFIIGAPTRSHQRLYNSAILIEKGQILGIQHKTLLPTYDVFDETRYFDASPDQAPILFRGKKLGIKICEDAWVDQYEKNPPKNLIDQGAEVMINISASPFESGKDKTRYTLYQDLAKQYQCPLLMVNQVGGNDDLIFDGNSLAFNGAGELIHQSPAFEENRSEIVLDQSSILFTSDSKLESIHQALCLGIRDYTHKCGFRKVVIGLSGGIDSALVAVLAVDALGAENVTGISMPSHISSPHSIDDARALADTLEIECKSISIQKTVDTLQYDWSDLAQENIQARVRGTLLMAHSNTTGALLLTTGNKSELAVGYCTLYGDMCGGLAVISDLPKTLVYELARHAGRIPESTLTKPPSAELSPDQTDQDTLPPYDILDQILYDTIENHLSADQIIQKQFDSETVHWVIDAVRKTEYKRYQAPPGLKVTSKAFGTGRRIPIAMTLTTV